MSENTLPAWDARLDARRQTGFNDLVPLLADNLRLLSEASAFLGPYNARQRASTSKIYQAPDKEALKASIRQGRVNLYTYQAFISSLVTFCEKTKGTRALPEPHPSTIHNIQLSEPTFEMFRGNGNDTIIFIAGVKEPLVVSNLRNSNLMKFIIVRPKLSKLGTASANNWEVLFFKNSYGYIPTWVDSNLNPRYSGIY